MRPYLLLLVLLGVVISPVGGRAAEINSPAPGFSLSGPNGRNATLDSLKGKVVFLDFWAPWCGPCTEEFPALDALYRKFRSDGFEVVGITVDSSEAQVARFLAKHPVSFSVVLDEKGAAARAYRFSNLPTGFLVGKDGVIRYIHKGFSRDFLPMYEKEITELLRQR